MKWRPEGRSWPMSFLAFVAFAMVIGLLPPRPMRAQLADAASPPKTWDTSWDTFIDEIERLYRSGTSAAGSTSCSPTRPSTGKERSRK